MYTKNPHRNHKDPKFHLSNTYQLIKINPSPFKVQAFIYIYNIFISYILYKTMYIKK